MSAAIKMDELLVNWLGSDAVYENVLEWIENYHRSVEDEQSYPEADPALLMPELPTLPSGESYHSAMIEPSPSMKSSASSKGNHENNQKQKTIPPFYPHKGPRWGKQIAVQDSWEHTCEAPQQGNHGAGKADGEPAEVAVDEDGEEELAAQRLPAKEAALQVFSELGEEPKRETNSDGSTTSTESNHQNMTLTQENFVRITKEVCHFPSYMNIPLYQRILDVWNNAFAKEKGEEATVVSYAMLAYYWKQEMEAYDASDRFFRLVKQLDADCIVRDDFLPFIKAILHDHPGLEFLSQHQEFQEKYAVTVITRIFYSVNRGHSGRISARQVRQSDLLQAFQQVDEEEDINKVTRYFSYEHFYVLYCRFWELDHDRDYRITREDLLKYGDHSLSHMIVDRIFDAAPRPFVTGSTAAAAATTAPNNNSRDFLSYEDFIYFMLSEEDKSNEVSVRYWFQCVDVDGDGKLNNMEMRSFYAVQLHRMQCMGHEIVPFEDMLCQMMDMIKPANPDCLVTEDFLQPECAQVSGALFDALFNLNKYLLFEQRDPFVERQKREDEFVSDWDRFACIDYNRLAMEEEAREEEAMEIDWVTVDEEEEQQQQQQQQQGGAGEQGGGSREGGGGGRSPSNESPF